MEAAFLAALPQIEDVVKRVGRRHGMCDDAIEEFASQVKLSMVETGYRALTRFEGRSSLPTYLRTVVGRMLIDFQRRQDGKWRSSARARHLGPKAVELERLIFRDGMTCSEAAWVSATRRNEPGPEAGLAMLQHLGARSRRKTIPIEAAMGLSDPAPLPDHAAFLGDCSTRLEEGVRRALAKLTARDRAFVHLRFEHGWSAKDIGLAFDLPSRFVYQRTESLLRTLREALQREGLTWREASHTTGRSTWTLRWPEEAQAFAGPPPIPVADRRVVERQADPLGDGGLSPLCRVDSRSGVRSDVSTGPSARQARSAIVGVQRATSARPGLHA